MEYHKVAFPQAMNDLAEKYRISLPKKQLTPSEKKNMELKELLFKLNETAAEYFHHILIFLLSTSHYKPDSIFVLHLRPSRFPI